ncbi:HNH endonuclease [Gemella bergeri]
MRADKTGTHRVAFDKNKKRLLKTQNYCGICGKPVDKSIKYPDPLSPVIDHIIPVAKGGHPSDLDNLQLAHFHCNREKADKLFNISTNKKADVIGNRNLPQTMNWVKYKGK